MKLLEAQLSSLSLEENPVCERNTDGIDEWLGSTAVENAVNTSVPSHYEPERSSSAAATANNPPFLPTHW